MKIVVKVKPNAKVESVERLTQPDLGIMGNTNELVVYKVSVKQKPVLGKANEAVIKALAKYFNTSVSLVRLVSGQTSKQKVFEIL